jgi:hypothetical protein
MTKSLGVHPGIRRVEREGRGGRGGKERRKQSNSLSNQISEEVNRDADIEQGEKEVEKAASHYVCVREQFFHDEVVVNLPGQLSPLLHRLQLLVAFYLKKENEENCLKCHRQKQGHQHNKETRPKLHVRVNKMKRPLGKKNDSKIRSKWMKFDGSSPQPEKYAGSNDQKGSRGETVSKELE